MTGQSTQRPSGHASAGSSTSQICPDMDDKAPALPCKAALDGRDRQSAAPPAAAALPHPRIGDIRRNTLRETA